MCAGTQDVDHCPAAGRGSSLEVTAQSNSCSSVCCPDVCRTKLEVLGSSDTGQGGDLKYALWD